MLASEFLAMSLKQLNHLYDIELIFKEDEIIALTKKELFNICQKIILCSTLKQVNLADNNLTLFYKNNPENFTSLFKSLSFSKSLTKLTLSCTNLSTLSDDASNILYKYLAIMPNLTALSLADNMLQLCTNFAFIKICSALQQFKRLTILDLSNTCLDQLTDFDFNHICIILSKFYSLKEIYLHYNELGELTEKQFCRLCSVLSNLPNLQILDLGDNYINITMPKAEQILNIYKKRAATLEKLNLTNNQALPYYINGLQTLSKNTIKFTYT